jgi:uncharacterized protein (DUF1800 family)
MRATSEDQWTAELCETAWLPFEPTSADPFDIQKAIHLLRRAGMGGNDQQLAKIRDQGPVDAVDSLLDPEEAKHFFDIEADAMIRTSLVLGDTDNLVDWWLYRMLMDPHPVREKATLMWHGHFCTSRAKVPDPHLLYEQNSLLRQHALGSFAELVKQMSRNAAMLVYLDSTENKKNRPNENYARELLELFCLGLGNYSEQDIKELARCFTGWEVRRRRFRISRSDHDYGVKTVLGHSAAMDGDQAIDVILDHPATARFIARRLIHFYVTEDKVPETVVDSLADKIRDAEWEIAPVLKTVFASRLFYSRQCRNRIIASPICWTISWMKTLETSGDLNQLRRDLEIMGQVPLEPPNVKGWPGGTAWIDPSRVAARVNWSHRLAQQTSVPESGLTDWLGRATDSESDVADWIENRLIGRTLAPERSRILRQQISTQSSSTERLRMGIRVAGLMPESYTV